MSPSLSITKYLPALLLGVAILPCTPLNAQLAREKTKFLGNVIPRSTPADFMQFWNQVTPENAGKWGSVERVRDKMNWQTLDNAYAYAKKNGLPFKQHTLVWGQQQPPWIHSLPPEEQRREVEEWIRAFCERYPDADYIDVVNEPLHAPPAYAPAIGGSGITGWDWVIWAFQKTREYCPNAKLVLNDYKIVTNDTATTRYLAIIKLLRERRLIDVIGEQGHFMETTPAAIIKRNLDRLQQTGLPIQISEYDVNLADDAAQIDVYKTQFPVLWEHPGVQGITLWGYREGSIWRKDAYLIRADGSQRPALQWLSEYIAKSKASF